MKKAKPKARNGRAAAEQLVGKLVWWSPQRADARVLCSCVMLGSFHYGTWDVVLIPVLGDGFVCATTARVTEAEVSALPTSMRSLVEGMEERAKAVLVAAEAPDGDD